MIRLMIIITIAFKKRRAHDSKHPSHVTGTIIVASRAQLRKEGIA
jgi:hypothetical protein